MRANTRFIVIHLVTLALLCLAVFASAKDLQSAFTEEVSTQRISTQRISTQGISTQGASIQETIPQETISQETIPQETISQETILQKANIRERSLQGTEETIDRKLITAGGTITEIVFALGAGTQVIAVDQSSQYPIQARQLPMIGYYRELAAEGVLSFSPDKILAIEGVGRKEVIEQIKKTGVDVVIYPKPTSTDGLVRLIEQLGRDLNKQLEANKLISQFQSSLPVKATAQQTKAIYLLSASDRGLIAAGTNTVPQLIFNYAGIENIGAQHEGFKGINNESLAMMQPDFIIAPRHVVMASGGKDKFCSNPNLALLTAAQECRLLVMDSLMSLGMTPRLAQAIATVKNWQEEGQ